MLLTVSTCQRCGVSAASPVARRPHVSPPMAGGRLHTLTGTTGAHAHVLARDLVIGLAVESGVGDHLLHVAATPGVEDLRLEVLVVRPAAGGGAGGEDQVAFRRDGQRQLGQLPWPSAIGVDLPVPSRFSASFQIPRGLTIGRPGRAVCAIRSRLVLLNRNHRETGPQRPPC
jgi:hypothetical protein